jgi:hypothetical protein
MGWANSIKNVTSKVSRLMPVRVNQLPVSATRWQHIGLGYILLLLFREKAQKFVNYSVKNKHTFGIPRILE